MKTANPTASVDEAAKTLPAAELLSVAISLYGDKARRIATLNRSLYCGQIVGRYAANYEIAKLAGVWTLYRDGAVFATARRRHDALPESRRRRRRHPRPARQARRLTARPAGREARLGERPGPSARPTIFDERSQP